MGQAAVAAPSTRADSHPFGTSSPLAAPTAERLAGGTAPPKAALSVDHDRNHGVTQLCGRLLLAGAMVGRGERLPRSTEELCLAGTKP